MTTIAGHTNAAFVEHAALSANDVPPTNQPPTNSVTTADHSQQSSGSSPTDGARGATNVPLTYEETERLTAERLASNPDFRELSVKLDTWKDLENDFALIDAHTGIFTSDGTVTLDNLKAIANDPFFPDEDAKAAAKRLLSHMPIWNELAKGDNKVGTHDVTEFLNALRAQLKGMKEDARAQIVAEHAPVPSTTSISSTAQTGAAAATGTPAAGAGAASGTPTAGGAAETDPKKVAAKAIMDEAEKSLPKPAPSQFAGMEGASENMNNMIGWAEAETDRLTTLMGKTDDPAVLKQLETKINQMSRRMQQMTALMNQLMTALQNISKLYSDIAMNSVRNMR